MKMSKKGAANIWTIFAVCSVLILGYMFLSGGEASIDFDTTLETQNTPAVVDVSLSSVESGVSSVESSAGSNVWTLTLSDSNLNSANITEISFTIDSIVQSAEKSITGDFVDYQLVYEPFAMTFDNVDDTTDTTEYRPFEWDSNTLKYNVSLDGTSNAFVNQASDTVTVGTDGTAVALFNVEDYTTLDKGIENDFESMILGGVYIKLDGQKVGQVNMQYIQ